MLEDFGDELTIEFRETIELGKGQAAMRYDSITLREPNGETLQAAAMTTKPYDALFILISNTSGMPLPAVKKMLQRDLDRAADFFAHFSPSNSEETSESSPQS